MREELVLVDVEDLEAAQAWVLFDHLVADVHCFIISVVHAGLDVRQIQGLLPLSEPVLLWISWSNLTEGDWY